MDAVRLETAGLGPREVEALVAAGALVPDGDERYVVGGTAGLGWHQRAWVAVLEFWPAALTHESALRAAEGPGRRGRDDSVIHVGIARARSVPAPPPDVVVHELHKFDPRVAWDADPPRMRYEEAIVDCAADAATDEDAVAIVLDTCRGHGSTAALTLAALLRRTNHPRRRVVKQTLEALLR